ncbi:TrmH family RNA methyltransferase [Serinibacter salmoneus]|uniref:tRNA G18 (Ribose-2'-O)-methylase SpoU n=1 Tax=Serinibacter salmoneus TaxID=556530 RepID=A0A2A9D2E1_9MICO|nr:TrmH family RNA methyltransferase [Serinibacter salmoneus]PFG20823.1 tRNA G18 (ribose-2'-O)-methylase SpoU [Serinibacter salmoneus]
MPEPDGAAPPPAGPEPERVVGVGPWPAGPDDWPEDPRLDPELLAHGDRRNVVDGYRYWRLEAIVADLDTRRTPLHVAIENLEHDMNIGSIVRTANAFNLAGVHVIGRRRWNRRGAMVTDRYLHVHHHPDAETFATWAHQAGLAVVGIDNVPGSSPIERGTLPHEAVLVFGSEGPGLSADLLARCAQVRHITQYGSTRSINAGAAGAIAMYEWMRQHTGEPAAQSADSAGSEART